MSGTAIAISVLVILAAICLFGSWLAGDRANAADDAQQLVPDGENDGAC